MFLTPPVAAAETLVPWFPPSELEQSPLSYLYCKHFLLDDAIFALFILSSEVLQSLLES